jgi:hypothetical protein
MYRLFNIKNFWISLQTMHFEFFISGVCILYNCQKKKMIISLNNINQLVSLSDVFCAR